MGAAIQSIADSNAASPQRAGATRLALRYINNARITNGGLANGGAEDSGTEGEQKKSRSFRRMVNPLNFWES